MFCCRSPGFSRPSRRSLARNWIVTLSATRNKGPTQQDRWIHVDHRARLSNEWAPSGGIAAGENEDAHSKLVRAGFLRQSHSGLFHMLPLGRRVEDKVQHLIDSHMRGLGASRLSLSTISSEALWEKSGRLPNVASELFHFVDRKGAQYLLSPTHEEEITSLVARTVKSYKQLPLRLYQITRKYRDEFRPRHGLLRGREFLMKDLYTFDATVPSALETYKQVRAAYDKVFADLKLPILVAKASSGDMGGDLSHEYHLATPLGEDHVVSCSDCDYTINDELAETRTSGEHDPNAGVRVWRGITKDRSTLVNVWYPQSIEGVPDDASGAYTDVDVNIYAVKSLLPDLDGGIENPLPYWSDAISNQTDKGIRLVNIVDSRLPSSLPQDIRNLAPGMPIWPDGLDQEVTPSTHSVITSDRDGLPLNMLRIRTGDKCPRCSSGSLKVQKAIELGHTFHLGTRYSEPLEARVSIPAGMLPDLGHRSGESQPSSTPVDGEVVSVPMQMGCYGIGVSRIIGAVADHLADEKGLNWPRKIAPYEVVVIPGKGLDGDAAGVFDTLSGQEKPTGGPRVDAVLDDRDSSFGWKLNDADLIGYPVMVVLGREWKAHRRCEVQCRRLGVKETVGVEELTTFVNNLLDQL